MASFDDSTITQMVSSGIGIFGYKCIVKGKILRQEEIFIVIMANTNLILFYTCFCFPKLIIKIIIDTLVTC